MLKKKYLRQRLECEVRESLEHKLVLRREAPIIGLVAFSVALWVSKLFTAISPGTSLVFQLWDFNVHLHHFNYGFVLLLIGLLLTFFEGQWFVRVQHSMFGVGLGFIVDEYWLLLIFDDHSSTYFGPESQYISTMIGLVITITYAVIAFGVFFKSKREIKLWKQLYEAVKSGETEIQFKPKSVSKIETKP
ncbi:hypothetical protein E2P63_03175 [Candidatus Bathyarchaeota archaeon]|nr:hypothetical protein E2P63_03175 [Candidatus Bathyarchaeota archaeon]